MNPKTVVFLCCLFWLAACSNNDPSLPTRVPTAMPIIPIPPTNTPISSKIEVETINDTSSDAAEIDPVLNEIDREVCQEIFETQAELDALQKEGKDVAELATAVAELADELENCESFMTPTPNN